jgi:hypothetical protein
MGVQMPNAVELIKRTIDWLGQFRDRRTVSVQLAIASGEYP